MPDTIIQATAVTKTYDTGEVKVDALTGVDLRIQRGEMLSVMGRSGCGKTTLLNCLSGLDDISSGEVLIEGKNIHQLKDNPRTDYRLKTMGFVFQFYNLLPVLTASENIEMPLLLAGLPPKEAKEIVEEIMDKVGLHGWERHYPSQLSGGQRQRVTIARALVNKPAIIWADEPTGDLDDDTSGEIVDLFVKLNKEFNQTFVIVTHDPAVAQRTHRLVRMQHGKVEADKAN
jgi:putative ABC transport system ATP-binding protein